MGEERLGVLGDLCDESGREDGFTAENAESAEKARCLSGCAAVREGARGKLDRRGRSRP
jgi:hypothetical protein